MEIEIRGHSGCQIDIVNGGDSLFINKSTRDKNYIPRLYKQALKQCNASKIAYQHIRVPKIYGIERMDEYLNIKMEYIYSKNYVDYFEDAGFDRISYFIKALKIFIDSEIENSKMTPINKNVVINKYNDVCDKVAKNDFISKDTDIKIILEKSSIVFNELDEEINIPVGQCHGDLTFSNILFNGNNYYLIDFLDSFLESPLLDLVKIRQDSNYGWSQLMYGHDFDSVRMRIISDKIDKEIDIYYSNYDWYNKYYSTFQLMNFLRVIQYAKEERTVAFLKNVLNSIL
jgi:thiamine kinase-like enzyme